MKSLLAQISLSPDKDGVPGIEQGEQIVQGLMFWALIGLGAAVVVGAVIWALSSRANNPHHASHGRGMALIALLGAIIVGAAAALINWAHRLGRQVESGGPNADAGGGGPTDIAAVITSLVDKL